MMMNGMNGTIYSVWSWWVEEGMMEIFSQYALLNGMTGMFYGAGWYMDGGDH
jgi:hypothetical protein